MIHSIDSKPNSKIERIYFFEPEESQYIDSELKKDVEEKLSNMDQTNLMLNLHQLSLYA
jgi:hypothetical protein